jgi:hypothetical protein
MSIAYGEIFHKVRLQEGSIPCKLNLDHQSVRYQLLDGELGSKHHSDAHGKT